jgi:hypothetical protein
VPAARRLLAAGADRADVVRLARHAAYAAVHSTLYRIDEGYDRGDEHRGRERPLRGAL